jgi:hypothetical protein
MTTRSFPIKTGDRLPILRFVPINGDGSYPDLTGATVVFNMSTSAGEALINRAAATIVDVTIDGVTRQAFQYAWGASDTATPGQHQAEFEATFPGGLPLTYPNDGFLIIKIGSDLG